MLRWQLQYASLLTIWNVLLQIAWTRVSIAARIGSCDLVPANVSALGLRSWKHFHTLAEDFQARQLGGFAYPEMDAAVFGILQQGRSLACGVAVTLAMFLRMERLIDVFTNPANTNDVLTDISRQLHGLRQGIEERTGRDFMKQGAEVHDEWTRLIVRSWRRIMDDSGRLYDARDFSADMWHSLMSVEAAPVTDEQYQESFEEIAEILNGIADESGLHWWPSQGTLIGLLRHGFRGGALAGGRVDIVDADVDISVGIDSHRNWLMATTKIETALLQKGWKACLHRSSLPDHSEFRSRSREDLFLCVRTQPYDFHLDLSSYLDVGHGDLYTHHFCRGDCKVPHRMPFGTMQKTGGRLHRSAVHPMGRCRVGRISVPCPRRPVATLHSMLGYNFSKNCVALPDVSGRVVRALPHDDPREAWIGNGLTDDDIEVLRERSAELDRGGFLSMTPFFPACRQVRDLNERRKITYSGDKELRRDNIVAVIATPIVEDAVASRDQMWFENQLENESKQQERVELNGKLQEGRELNDAIREALLSGKPILVGRLSCGAETDIMLTYMHSGRVEPKQIYHTLSGIYPATNETMLHYVKVWIEGLSKFGTEDLIGAVYCASLDGQRKIIKKYTSGARYFEKPWSWLGLTPFLFDHPWSSALRGKTVLIIHAFIDSIKCQVRRKSVLFNDPSVFPEMQLKYLKTVQALGNAKPHANWGESLRSMYRDIDGMGHFDVALIAGGAFGLPLASYVKTTRNVAAIMLGGASQLLFGLRGNRWDHDSIDARLVRPYIRDTWIHPLRVDTPQSANIIESACYWGTGNVVLDTCPI